MQQVLSPLTTTTLSRDSLPSSQSLTLYTIPVGGQAFAVQPDGTALIADRVPPEIDDLPLWLLSMRDRSGNISSFDSIKGAPRYFSTEDLLALASSLHADEWHQGTPPARIAKITQPLKEEPQPLPTTDLEEGVSASETLPEPLASTTQSSGRAPLSPDELERRQREKVAQTQIDRLANARATDIQKITATQLTLDNNYCQEALKQGQKSFEFAVKFAPWGIAFIAGSTLLLVVLTFTRGLGHLDTITAVVNAFGGLLVEGLPGVGFFLYYQASKQFKEFSHRIDLRNRYLLANSIIITSLDGQEKLEALKKLLESILQGEEPGVTTDSDAEKPQP